MYAGRVGGNRVGSGDCCWRPYTRPNCYHLGCPGSGSQGVEPRWNWFHDKRNGRADGLSIPGTAAKRWFLGEMAPTTTEPAHRKSNEYVPTGSGSIDGGDLRR